MITPKISLEGKWFYALHRKNLEAAL